MKHFIFALILLYIPIKLTAQQDTVFITKTEDWSADSLKYKTDTVIFSSGMTRHILIGTTILPMTHNQMNAKGYGFYLADVTKSECKKSEIQILRGEDKINSIINSDTSIVIDMTIYDNCCYDFLCDLSVDSSGTLKLLYKGYGTYCACECCFGLTYKIEKMHLSKPAKINAVMINNDESTIERL